jgi:hypothetical protein
MSPDRAAAFKPAKWLDPVMERPKPGLARLPPIAGDPHQVHARRRGAPPTTQKRHPEKFAALDQ